jgi:hypothetical protein
MGARRTVPDLRLNQLDDTREQPTAPASQAGLLGGGIGLKDLGEHHPRDLGRAERVFQVTGPCLARGSRVAPLDDPALRHNLPSQATCFAGRDGAAHGLGGIAAAPVTQLLSRGAFRSCPHTRRRR